MALDRVDFPTTPNPVSGDWAKLTELVEKSYQNVESKQMFLGIIIEQGTTIQVGGIIYYGTSDTIITGTSSNYVKLTPNVGDSGATCDAAFVFNLSGVTWNSIYGGYYDGSGNRHIFIEDLGKVSAYTTVDIVGSLLCDGATISKTTNPEYANLVNLLKREADIDTGHPYYHVDSDKCVLPDLVNNFIRGMPVSGRDSGEFQGSAVLNHAHDTVMGSHAHDLRESGGIISDNRVTTLSGNYDDTSGFVQSTNLGTKTSGNPKTGGDTESRPDNISLYYLIKY